MREGPPQKDSRTLSGEPLRKGESLPLRRQSRDQEELCYYEAQSSSLSWGTDECFWTELFLVDTWFGSEANHLTYLTDCQPGNGYDPPLGGGGSLENPCFDPREYFLLKLARRLEQAATEYSALIETFNKRLEQYVCPKSPYNTPIFLINAQSSGAIRPLILCSQAQRIKRTFHDDANQELTRTLSDVIDTIHAMAEAQSTTKSV